MHLPALTFDSDGGIDGIRIVLPTLSLAVMLQNYETKFKFISI